MRERYGRGPYVNIDLEPMRNGSFLKSIFYFAIIVLSASGCVSGLGAYEYRKPAQAAEEAEPVIVCRSTPVPDTDIKFFINPSSMWLRSPSRNEARHYYFEQRDEDIVTFFRSRSTKILNGSFRDKDGNSYSLKLTHMDGLPALVADSGFRINMRCTLSDGTEIAPPLPPKASRKLEFPVCERTRVVRDELERRFNRGCDSIGIKELTTVTQIDLSNRGITQLKDGDFEGFGYRVVTPGRSLLEISSINLSQNSLVTLPEGLFGRADTNNDNGLRYAYVKHFNLSHNRLQREPFLDLSEKFVSPMDQSREQDADKFWNLSFNELINVQLRYELCGNLVLSHNRISSLPKIIRISATCPRGQIQSIDLSSNFISDATFQGVEAIKINGFGKALLVEDNAITKFDLEKIGGFSSTAPRILDSLKLGGSGATTFDLSSLKKPWDNGYNKLIINNLEITGCNGTPGSDFPILNRLTLRSCDVSLPNGFGNRNELGSVRFEQVVISNINVDLLFKAIHFRKALNQGAEKWWLGVIEIDGKSQISRVAVESIRKAYALAEKDFYFAWDCSKHEDWADESSGTKNCRFLRLEQKI